MIDLTKEKERALSTQDIYDIVSFAVDAANDNGFMNTFILNRALYEFAVLILYPDRKDEFSTLVASNVNDAWDAMVEDGVLEEAMAAYPVDLGLLEDVAETWSFEYESYAHSARGVLDAVQAYSGNILSTAVNQLTQTAQDTGAAEILDIADKWGMNRPATIVKENTEKETESDSDSLFE